MTRATALLLAAWIEASTGRSRALLASTSPPPQALADSIGDIDLQARCCDYLAYVVSHEGSGSRAGPDRPIRSPYDTSSDLGTRPRTRCSPRVPRSPPWTANVPSKPAMRWSTGCGPSRIRGCTSGARRVRRIGPRRASLRRCRPPPRSRRRSIEPTRVPARPRPTSSPASGEHSARPGDYEAGAATLELASEGRGTATSDSPPSHACTSDGSCAPSGGTRAGRSRPRSRGTERPAGASRPRSANAPRGVERRRARVRLT